MVSSCTSFARRRNDGADNLPSQETWSPVPRSTWKWEDHQHQGAHAHSS